MKLTIPNFGAAHATRFVMGRSGPAAAPAPTTADLARLGALLDQAVSVGVAAAWEGHEPFAQALDPLDSQFGRYLARLVTEKLRARR